MTESSPHDDLDGLEARVWRALAPDVEDWSARLDEVEREALEKVTLLEPPPSIDPSEGRRSSAELRNLIHALRGAPKAPPKPTRGGYAIQTRRGGDRTEVLPAFAAALGLKGLREDFANLWSVDAELWDRLDGADARELARCWLESPGRRLIQDLRVLEHAPRSEPLGATVLSLERLYAAAGLNDQPAAAEDLPAWMQQQPVHRRPWRELHAAIPGRGVEGWAPRHSPARFDEPVPRPLWLLESGRPIGLRGAALWWLLDRAARDPFYEVDGLRRDLREDLPARLAVALRHWLGEERDVAGREVEALALQHAARITRADEQPGAVARAWGLARWLQVCLRRSPFYGRDEEVMATHLQARLPEVIPPLPGDADALDPARFDPEARDGLDPAEIALLGGTLAHYRHGWCEPGKILLPTPLPLVHALQRIAGREVRPGEDAADEALAAGHNELGWPAPHVAPPLAARWLLTELRIGWMGQVGEAAQRDTIARLLRDPARYAWAAWAIHRGGMQLAPAARQEAADALRTFLGVWGGPSGEAAGVLVAGVLPELSDDEACAAAAWADAHVEATSLLDALAGAAEAKNREAVWVATEERLLGRMARSELSDKARMDAALVALRRASGSQLARSAEILGRIAEAVAAPPFNQHLGLRRELRRLGLEPKIAGGGQG